ncbi:sporulation initiation inhibitor Soj [Clostridia bacterium]|nr:sporulation initiation inhibitor Soj [Clostridia bacterium]
MIISFANQKGGVGKTTSAINVAASLGRENKKVLLVDLDPQGNATSGVGVNKREVKCSSYDAIIGRSTASEAVVKTAYDNLYVIPSHINLAGAELEFLNDDTKDRFFRLRVTLSQLEAEYDYIIVDCPPALGLLTVNALCASDFVVVPMQCEYFAMEGLSQLTNTIRQVKQTYNRKVEIAGILINMYDGRLNLSIQVLEELKKFFPDKILKTPVPRTIRLGEAPSHGLPIFYYDSTNRASECFIELAREIDSICMGRSVVNG